MWYPNMVPHKSNNFELTVEGTIGTIYLDNQMYMRCDSSKNFVYEDILAHNYIAHGHVIATGMGFLIREKLLLDNPKVEKLTVLEISSDLIDYHCKYNKDVIDRIDVVQCDANEYKGSCDVLLVDHHDDAHHWENYAKCVENIDHKVSWFWPIEAYVQSYSHYKNLMKHWPTLPDLSEEKFTEFKSRYENIWL